MCDCGKLHTKSTMNAKKYIIDFTVARHGQYTMAANSEKEARKMFDEFIKENKREASIFMDHFTFDCEIKTNYAYRSGV